MDRVSVIYSRLWFEMIQQYSQLAPPVLLQVPDVVHPETACADDADHRWRRSDSHQDS